MGKLHLGLQVGLGLALVAGCSSGNGERSAAETARAQATIDALETVPYEPDMPPEHIATFKNANGEEIELTITSGEPYVERRDYRRYAGLIMDCYERPLFAKVDNDSVLNRTLIAVLVGSSVELTVAPPYAPTTLPAVSDSGRTLYCQPAFVTDIFPAYDGESPLQPHELQRYCMDTTQQAIAPVVPSEDLRSCQVTY